MKNHIVTRNNGVPIALADVPVLAQLNFEQEIASILTHSGVETYPVAYFAHQLGDEKLRLFAVIANQQSGELFISSYNAKCGEKLHSMAVRFPAFTIFEREISEKYGVIFENNPWPKPVRFPHDRSNKESSIENYPFYKIQGEDIHEVNVGPVHAGIIEPGVFRFLCEGETIFHLEIVLGYQHRGIEGLIESAGSVLRRMCLAEQIAGDTTVGHAVAMALIMEQGEHNGLLDSQRVVALEMERMAMHLADTGALCGDMAYQLGQVACEALRTIVINTMQLWCGNRFGRGLIRPFGTDFHLNLEKIDLVKERLGDVQKRFAVLAENLFNNPSVLARLDEICAVDGEIAMKYGAVGMAARSSGISRDCRGALGFAEIEGFESMVECSGDLMARLRLRTREVSQSYEIILGQIRRLSGEWFEKIPQPDYSKMLKGDMLNIALVEGWRGMICHAAITNSSGGFATYRVFDPSLRNWLMLALSVRGAEISNFPLSNKSYNLSYCGHDL